MNDLKNALIAWSGSSWAVFAAIETPAIITTLSAVLLPIVFFVIGKAIDVALQIYLKDRDKE